MTDGKGVGVEAPAPAAVAYLRVSTAEQAANGLGLDVQRDLIVEWAGSTGRVITGWHIDAGRSGSNGIDDRIGLADAMNDLASKEPGAPTELVVACLDRLARDLVLQELLLSDVRATGASLRSCDPSEDANLALGSEDDDPTRVLIRQVLGAVKEFDRKMIRLRLVRGRRLKNLRGGYIGGPVGLGRVVAGDGFAPDPETWPILERIGTERTGGAGYQGIADRLNLDGVPAPLGGEWMAQTVRRCYLRWAKMTGSAVVERGTNPLP